MRLDIRFDDPNGIVPGLINLDANEADNIQNYVVAEISKDYADFQKHNYLSGQYLNNLTGETYGSVKFFKLNKGYFAIRPGAGVSGRLNYLSIIETGGEIQSKKDKMLAFEINGNLVFARSVHVDPKPFVEDSKRDYETSNRPMILMRNIWTQVLQKKGLA